MAGPLYAAIFLLALIPGLPLGFALFGRRHAGGWIAGALFGYVATALAIWAPIRLAMPSATAFAIAWLVIGAITWALTRGLPEPMVSLPAWTRRDTAGLAAVWLLALAIAVPPFWRVGEVDGNGGRRFRAYFTADFVWHTALAAEITKFDSPPRNPYLAPRPIHYYWGYFLLPSAVAAVAPFEDPQVCLAVNAVATALLFVSAIFLGAWTAVPRAGPVAAGVALAIVASSAEGSFALWRFWQQGVPLAEVRNLNIDAIANWWFRGVRTDGLQRCFWWVPQHSMAYALGLIAFAVVNAAGSAAPTAAIVLAGAALGGSTMMNPFVGGIFSTVWGCAVVADAARAEGFIRRVARHGIAIVPVALALGWIMGNRMAEGGGSALQFGWLIGDAKNAPVTTLFLSLGPALVLALVGISVPLNVPPKGGSYRDSNEGSVVSAFSTAETLAKVVRRSVPAMLLAGGSLLLLFCARLNVDLAWIGFRSGQLFLIAVPALIARGFVAPAAWRRLAIGTAVVALLAGVPTTAIDLYNAQDVTNVSDSPIGPWTVIVSRDQQEGLRWLRQTTPSRAIVQMEPLVRDRSTWSLIPSFAQRRMAAGRPISLLGGTADRSEYAEKSARVRAMYETPNPPDASAIARSLRIDYVWVDAVERTAYPAGVAKFDAAPDLFDRVFKNAEVSIYRVR